ncbi:MAG: Bro-N domain-containing protein [Bacilli bacterium]
MDNEIVKVFESKDFGKIRTTKINGEPWFVGKDIAECLGYERATKAIQDHVDNEDKDEFPIRDSIGRNQKTPVINESGLYSLIMNSQTISASKKQLFIISMQKQGYL